MRAFFIHFRDCENVHVACCIHAGIVGFDNSNYFGYKYMGISLNQNIQQTLIFIFRA